LVQNSGIGIAIAVEIPIGGILSFLEPGPDCDNNIDPGNARPDEWLQTGRALQSRAAKEGGFMSTDAGENRVCKAASFEFP